MVKSVHKTSSKTSSSIKMIAIHLYEPPFCGNSLIQDNGMALVPEGCTLGLLIKLLNIPFPFRAFLIAYVNYKRVLSSYVLQEQDTVSFFWPVSGG